MNSITNPEDFLKKPERESRKASEISERSKNYNLKTVNVLKETDKTDRNALAHDWPGENLNMRVRSWLRINAGGVLNTCKSNGAFPSGKA